MNITIIGAGPAGSWAAIALAKRGHAVTLIDSHAPWEKPCGGGITAKALAAYSVFDSALPRQYVERISIHYGDRNCVTVRPQQPLAVVSRQELGKYLLDQAISLGACFIKTRVTKMAQSDGRWALSTRESALQADFLIGADGASSLVRRSVSAALAPEDLSVTLGYFLPGTFSSHMKIFFVPDLRGYIWSFPRSNHTSYGLITRSEPGWTARAKSLLSNFIVADLGPDIMQQAEFYSAPVPCLGPRTWAKNRIAGDRWALIGDAAGFADPITGEGIHFAFESAQILADHIDRPAEYADRAWHEIGRELARAARMYRRFYSGSFLGADFKKRTVQFSNRSRTLKAILGDVIAGNQSYLGLKRRLVLSVPRIGWDFVTRNYGVPA
jgi:geranylgeranyl reductase family protein